MSDRKIEKNSSTRYPISFYLPFKSDSFYQQILDRNAFAYRSRPNAFQERHILCLPSSNPEIYINNEFLRRLYRAHPW